MSRGSMACRVRTVGFVYTLSRTIVLRETRCYAAIQRYRRRACRGCRLRAPADPSSSLMSRSPSSAARRSSQLPVSVIGRTGRGVVFAGIAERFLDVLPSDGVRASVTTWTKSTDGVTLGRVPILVMGRCPTAVPSCLVDKGKSGPC